MAGAGRHLSFHLNAPRGSALAQRVQLALALRGARLCLSPAKGALRLRVACMGQDKLVVTDEAAMLDLIGPLFGEAPCHAPDQRAMIEGALQAEAALAAVLAAQDARDLDLAVYWLRPCLLRLEAAVTPALSGELQAADVALAPLLWRLQVLDRRFGAALAAGMPRLRAHGARLLALPQVAAVLDPAAAERLAAGLRETGAALADAGVLSGWERAFAPPAAGNNLLFAGQRRKVPSIGRSGALH